MWKSCPVRDCNPLRLGAEARIRFRHPAHDVVTDVIRIPGRVGRLVFDLDGIADADFSKARFHSSSDSRIVGRYSSGMVLLSQNTIGCLAGEIGLVGSVGCMFQRMM